MSFPIRVIIGFFCALLVAAIIDVRLGNQPCPYTVISAAPSALLAPTLLPTLAYKERFRSKEMSESTARGEGVDIAFEQNGNEGVYWGVLLAIAFYLPINILPKKSVRS